MPSFDESDRLFNLLDGKAAILLIAQLPEMYKSVMSMRYSDDLSLREISIKTGKTENAISVQVYRGTAKLKLFLNLKKKKQK